MNNLAVLLAVAFGGAIGSVGRYLVSAVWMPAAGQASSPMPWWSIRRRR